MWTNFKNFVSLECIIWKMWEHTYTLSYLQFKKCNCKNFETECIPNILKIVKYESFNLLVPLKFKLSQSQQIYFEKYFGKMLFGRNVKLTLKQRNKLGVSLEWKPMWRSCLDWCAAQSLLSLRKEINWLNTCGWYHAKKQWCLKSFNTVILERVPWECRNLKSDWQSQIDNHSFYSCLLLLCSSLNFLNKTSISFVMRSTYI